MVIQLIAAPLGLYRFFYGPLILFFVGGFTCLASEIYSFSRGELNPLFPTVLIIGSVVILKSWHGILLGAILSTAVEVAFMPLFALGALAYTGCKKLRKQT